MELWHGFGAKWGKAPRERLGWNMMMWNRGMDCRGVEEGMGNDMLGNVEECVDGFECGG